MLHDQSISDFTSSEWNLALLTRICKLISDNKPVGAEQIISLVRHNTHLTNRAVIARHIRIMSKIGVLAPEEGYLVTGEGKSLLAFTKDKAEWGSLTNYEKLFYYLRLFGSAYTQLTILLETLDNRGNQEDKVSLSYKYFQRIYESGGHIWSKATIRDGLSLYERRRIMPKGLQTKFDCMLKWLQQLDLVVDTDITLRGRTLLSYLTRNWRVVTGNPNADITAIRYDQKQKDYEITFAPSISDEVIESLAEGLG